MVGVVVIVAFRVSRVANREKPVAMREPRCAIRDYPHRSFHLGAARQRPRRIANSFSSRDLRHHEKNVDEHGLKDAVRYANLHGGAP